MIETVPHTRLMNKSIMLHYSQSNWPSVLHDCGYRIGVIEQTLRTRSQTAAKPDIISVSKRDRHVLVLECKSGSSISAGQEKRYGDLDMDTLRQWVDSNVPPENHTVAYAINGDGLERIKSHTNLPMIVFYDTHLLGVGMFGAKGLDSRITSPVSLEGMMEPTDQYPYGHEDSDALIAQYVLQGLVRLISKKEIGERLDDDKTVEEIFKMNHRYHRLLSADVSNKLRRKIKNIIKSNFLTDPKVVSQLAKVREGGRGSAAWASLRKACDDNVEWESRQARL